MKRHALAPMSAPLAVALCCLAPLAAQEQSPMSPDVEAMMKLASPGEHHKHLDHMIGRWEIQGKIWMVPGADPIEATSTMEARWVLGGRFVESVTKGTLMGMPFEGISLEGYDNMAEKHVSKWVDNFGTYFMDFQGTCADGGRVRTMTAKTYDPQTGESSGVKGVTTVTGKDTYTYEMYSATPQGEVKVMELSYRRL